MRADVALEVCGGSEACAALRARVGSLVLDVQLSVRVAISRRNESGVATREPAHERPITAVGAPVHVQIRQVLKRSITSVDAAHVAAHFRVNEQVRRTTAPLREPRSAPRHVACIRPLPGVHTRVPLELGRHVKRCRTHFTRGGERLGRRVTLPVALDVHPTRRALSDKRQGVV